MSEARKLQAKGVRQFQQHNYDESVESFREAITAYESEDDHIMAAEMKVNLGLAYRSMDQFDQAIDYMTQGLNTFREHGDRYREAQALGNMALVYAKQENEEQATTLYREAADIFREEGDDENYGQTILAMADMQFKAGKLMQAVGTFEVGLEHIKNPNLRQKMAKQLLLVKNRMMGEKKGAKPPEGGTLAERRARRKLRRNEADTDTEES